MTRTRAVTCSFLAPTPGLQAGSSQPALDAQEDRDAVISCAQRVNVISLESLKLLAV